MFKNYSTTPYIFDFSRLRSLVKDRIANIVPGILNHDIDALVMGEVMNIAERRKTGLRNLSDALREEGIGDRDLNEFMLRFYIVNDLCWKAIEIPDRAYVAEVKPFNNCTLLVTFAKFDH